MSITTTPAASVIAVASVDQLRGRLRKKSRLKGRQPEASSMADVQALIGPGPRRRDLLIEHLCKVTDLSRGLHDHHRVAVARHMNPPMARLYEVVTVYQRFKAPR